jgi:AcrR family transcriptional regulator
MISRQKLLEAALRVFAESGFRGATTKRIAEEAGVNEVTLFRLFKSKSALIGEAAQMQARRRVEYQLPRVSTDPGREVTEWCKAQLDSMHRARAVIRKCLAELEEHPEMADCMRVGPTLALSQLRDYAMNLCRARGLDIERQVVATACTMLMGALFADAMGRDMTPGIYPQRSRAAAQYARLFLRTLGLDTAASHHGNGRRRTRFPAA